MTKVLAYYLPQFHETEENNKWWGKGFTEWTGVKEAKPLYAGHYQPAEPLDDNYYDLTDARVLKWQSELAREYGIYGFCIHHYWFNGKRLLYKPAELLLEHRDIDISFCFSWANESWIRTWNRGDGNIWAVKRDAAYETAGDGMLMQQEYGGRDDWEKHFMYLLAFFQDGRYIKIDNKPMLLIYHPEKIPCLHSMLKVWDELAHNSGFDGLYIVSTNNLKIQDRLISANAIFEPSYYFNTDIGFLRKAWIDRVYRKRRKGEDCPLYLSYADCWNKIIRRTYESGRETYPGGMVSFDKTPREGKNATIYRGANPARFQKFFRRLYQRSEAEGKEFVFMNAWNEWGEGCALEPDKKYKYRYLEAVRDVIKECSL